MKTLDSVSSMEKLDCSGVLQSISMFPDQCLDAWNTITQIPYPETYKKAKNIVVCGMGGSRFTPKTIKELFFKDITVPYEIMADYNLPGYVNSDTLFILSSYSGSTEEPISCAYQAIQKHAMLTGIAKGGEAITLLRNLRVPYYQFDAQYNPCGQPRVGGGYLLMGHLGILSQLGFVHIPTGTINSAIEFCRTYSKKLYETIPEKINQAKQLAIKIQGNHPFLIASEFLQGAVNGFANQINETAKTISDFRYIPELNHHLMEGLQYPDSLHENGIFIFFTSSLYGKKIQKRFSITEDIVKKQHLKTITISLTGQTPMEQVMEMYALGAYTTFYLAMLNNINPVSIPWVDYFKKQLAE